YEAHHPPQQADSDDELDRQLDEALYHSHQEQYFTPGGSSS
ncbi:hypothetical protein A2U01_0090329, partial [Trifolium medium]|nr:hypothetical protein [Trifolium medium]